MKRAQFLWNVLVTIAVVVVLLAGYQLYSMNEDVQRYARTAENEQFGTDADLDLLITYLEANLQKRELFTFRIRNKPVLLSNVIFLNEDLAAANQRNIIRVSAIIGGIPQSNNNHQSDNHKPETFVKTVGDNINLRQSPTLNAPVVTTLDRDTELRVLGESNQWYQIQVGETTGWIFSDLVTEKYFATGNGSNTGNPDAIALVQYRGKNYRLSVGDTLAGGKVLALRPQELVMRLNNRRVTFPVLSLSMTPQEAEKYRVD